MYMIRDNRGRYKTYDGWTTTVLKAGKKGTNGTLDGLNDTILFTKRERDLNPLPHGQRWVEFHRLKWSDFNE